MQPVESRFSPVHVGIITADLSRFPEFWLSLMRMYVPGGSTYSHIRGNGFAIQRNEIVRQFLKGSAEWLWFIDDDHSFVAETLMALLGRDVDIVQPLISTRKPPYRPYGYMWDSEHSEYVSIKWSDIPTNNSVMKVDAVGSGGTLYRRKVFETISDPWFEEGKTYPDGIGEDLWLCRKCQLANIQCWLDTGIRLGHMTTEEVWPVAHDGKWVIDLDQYHGVRVRVQPNIGMPKEVV